MAQQFAIDFSDVQTEFNALEPGEYDVVVAKVEMRESKSSEFPYLNWELDVIGEGDAKGRKLWFMTSFSPKAIWRMKEVFENLGVYQDNVSFNVDEDTNEVSDPELVGLPGRAVVVIEQYNGQDRNKVVTLLAADGQSGAGKKPGGKPGRTLR
jgi:hypothetical protein